MESIDSPTNSQPGSPISEDIISNDFLAFNETLPRSSISITSIFPPTQSHETESSESNERHPPFSHSMMSIFPPTQSHETGSTSESNETSFSYSITSIFRPTQSHETESTSKSNERLIPPFSHSITSIFPPTQSHETQSTSESNERLSTRSSHSIQSIFQPNKSDNTSSSDTTGVLPKQDSPRLWQHFTSNFGERREIGSHPQVQKEWQTSEGKWAFDQNVHKDVDTIDNCSGNTNEVLLMRFKTLLSLTSACPPHIDSIDVSEKSQVSSKISSLLEGDKDEWDQMLKLTSEKDFSPEKLEEKILEKLLKEKLHVWLLQKAAEGGKGPSVLDEDGQGVIHFAAALGYDWALEPTIIAGVSVNFRDMNGWAALHWAAFCGRERTVASLVSLGAAPGALTDPSPKYPSGRTAADLASDVCLLIHLSSLKLDTGEGDAAENSGAKAVQTDSERSPAPISDGDLPYGLSLKDSPAAVCNASKNYKRLIWSVGIVEKIILRWRRKGSGLRGFKSEALTEGRSRMEDTSSEDDYDFLKEGRKQTKERLQKALARVKSMTQYPDARDQYRRLRLLYVVTDIQGSKVVGDGVPNSSEEMYDMMT